MEGTDVCFAPVLSLTEAPLHPHNVQRGTFVERDGVVQPAPAPRFSATPTEIQRPPAHAGQHTDEVLADWGVNSSRIAQLRDAGAVRKLAPPTDPLTRSEARRVAKEWGKYGRRPCPPS